MLFRTGNAALFSALEDSYVLFCVFCVCARDHKHNLRNTVVTTHLRNTTFSLLAVYFAVYFAVCFPVCICVCLYAQVPPRIFLSFSVSLFLSRFSCLAFISVSRSVFSFRCFSVHPRLPLFVSQFRFCVLRLRSLFSVSPCFHRWPACWPGFCCALVTPAFCRWLPTFPRIVSPQVFAHLIAITFLTSHCLFLTCSLEQTIVCLPCVFCNPISAQYSKPRFFKPNPCLNPQSRTPFPDVHV